VTEIAEELLWLLAMPAFISMLKVIYLC
jgi:hypothetical protein